MGLSQCELGLGGHCIGYFDCSKAPHFPLVSIIPWCFGAYVVENWPVATSMHFTLLLSSFSLLSCALVLVYITEMVFMIQYYLYLKEAPGWVDKLNMSLFL